MRVGEFQVYQRLKEHGQIVKASSRYSESFWGSYGTYSYIVNNRDTVTRSEKCSGVDDFKHRFSDIQLVYNMNKPEEHWTHDRFSNFEITTASVVMDIIQVAIITWVIQYIFWGASFLFKGVILKDPA